MIYLISGITALLLTFLLDFFLVKTGYLDFSREGGKTISEERVEIPGKTDETSSETTEISEVKNDVGEIVEEKEELKFSPYNRVQGMIINILFFVFALVLNYLVVTYTKQNWFLFAKMGILHSIIAAAALTDYLNMKIPNLLIKFGIVARIVIYLFEFIFTRENFASTIKNDVLGFFIGFVMLFVIAIISHGGIGYGDVKLFGVIGVMAGSAGVFLTIFISLLINSIFAIILMIAKKKTLKSTLPMAPFIYIGFFVICLLGLF